jgi:hypothetical protein
MTNTTIIIIIIVVVATITRIAFKIVCAKGEKFTYLNLLA